MLSTKGFSEGGDDNALKLNFTLRLKLKMKVTFNLNPAVPHANQPPV